MISRFEAIRERSRSPSRIRFRVPSRCSFTVDPYYPKSEHASIVCPNQHAHSLYSPRPSQNSSVWRKNFDGNWQKETKDKIDEHEKQPKQLKGADSCAFIPDWNYLLSSRALTSENTTERVTLIPTSKCTVWQWLSMEITIKCYPRLSQQLWIKLFWLWSPSLIFPKLSGGYILLRFSSNNINLILR